MRPGHPAFTMWQQLSDGLPLLNAALSVGLTVCIVFLLIRYNHVYNLAERLGHGLAGAAVFISIFKQLGFAALILPFNDWYQVLWRVGWVLLLGGKVWRLEQHRRRNDKAAAEARAYLDARGLV